MEGATRLSQFLRVFDYPTLTAFDDARKSGLLDILET